MVDLDDLPRSEPGGTLRAEVVGAKAWNLVVASRAGLPVLPGFVLTTEGVRRGGPADAETEAALRRAWERVGGAATPLVVRSSSTVEDAADSSLAGRFTSLLDVGDWEAFTAAVATVAASAANVIGPDGAARPMAVLVQRQLPTDLGGVLFGVDPVTGDRRHFVIEAVPQRPDVLVSGRAIADHVVIGRRGRVIEATPSSARDRLTRARRRRLARIARRTERIFGGPQDIEWAVETGTGTLWVLQTRPVTAVAGPTTGVVLGPGPVAETFPNPLSRLEEDLWIDPVRAGITRALRATRAVPERRLDRSPVCVVVDGRPAVDLALFGSIGRGGGVLGFINPAQGVRRVRAAWSVGHLRVAVPPAAADLLARVDADLASVPRLGELTDAALADLLVQLRERLGTVHAYEMLAGMLLESATGGSAAGAALSALAAGRARGLSDAAIVRSDPVVLALVPPAIGPTVRLPAVSGRLEVGDGPGGDRVARLGRREALRLRTRWCQELMARAAWELGERLARAGRLPGAAAVADLGLDELTAIVGGGPVPDDVPERQGRRAGAPLPTAFRMTTTRDVVPAPEARRRGRRGDHDGIGAGGGRIAGVVVSPSTVTGGRRGDVLVVGDLEPGLAPLLTGLDGLVAERGSVLSHLAILAREAGVATVVGVPDALRRFPPGTRIIVDGFTGEVRPLDEEVLSR